MKERPILFSGPMVRAILDGRKTQTRRVVNERDMRLIQSAISAGECSNFLENGKTHGDDKYLQNLCRYGAPGDRLWVRETWGYYGYAGGIILRSPLGDSWRPDNNLPLETWWPFRDRYSGKMCPSIFMPRWASRITLDVISVRVERVRDISEQDAISEGITRRVFTRRDGTDSVGYCADWSRVGQLSRFAGGIFPRNEKRPLKEQDICLGSGRMAFANLWNSINEKRGYGWDTNPWVWVVEFERIEEMP